MFLKSGEFDVLVELLDKQATEAERLGLLALSENFTMAANHLTIAWGRLYDNDSGNDPTKEG